MGVESAAEGGGLLRRVHLFEVRVLQGWRSMRLELLQLRPIGVDCDHVSRGRRMDDLQRVQ